MASTVYKLITFNNPIKAYFSGKKYTVSNQRRPTQIENNVFLIEIPFKIGFLKIISVQKQLFISSGTDLLCNKI